MILYYLAQILGEQVIFILNEKLEIAYQFSKNGTLYMKIAPDFENSAMISYFEVNHNNRWIIRGSIAINLLWVLYAIWSVL